MDSAVAPRSRATLWFIAVPTCGPVLCRRHLLANLSIVYEWRTVWLSAHKYNVQLHWFTARLWVGWHGSELTRSSAAPQSDRQSDHIFTRRWTCHVSRFIFCTQSQHVKFLVSTRGHIPSDLDSQSFTHKYSFSYRQFHHFSTCYITMFLNAVMLHFYWLTTFLMQYNVYKKIAYSYIWSPSFFLIRRAIASSSFTCITYQADWFHLGPDIVTDNSHRPLSHHSRLTCSIFCIYTVSICKTWSVVVTLPSKHDLVTSQDCTRSFHPPPSLFFPHVPNSHPCGTTVSSLFTCLWRLRFILSRQIQYYIL